MKINYLLLSAFVIVATQPAAHAMLRGAARAAGAAAHDDAALTSVIRQLGRVTISDGASAVGRGVVRRAPVRGAAFRAAGDLQEWLTRKFEAQSDAKDVMRFAKAMALSFVADVITYKACPGVIYAVDELAKFVGVESNFPGGVAAMGCLICCGTVFVWGPFYFDAKLSQWEAEMLIKKFAGGEKKSITAAISASTHLTFKNADDLALVYLNLAKNPEIAEQLKELMAAHVANQPK